MGYQQSFVKFENKEALIDELKKYRKRDTSKDDGTVYEIVKVIKGVRGYDIKKGELMAVVGGDRYTQRSKEDILEFMGLDRVERVIFIDDIEFVIRSHGKLSKFLDEHFQSLDENEIDGLLSNSRTGELKNG